jgi:hypothetical protein
MATASFEKFMVLHSGFVLLFVSGHLGRASLVPLTWLSAWNECVE